MLMLNIPQDGKTALHVALSRGIEPVALKLVEVGCDVSATDQVSDVCCIPCSRLAMVDLRTGTR